VADPIPERARLADVLNRFARPLTGNAGDLDPVLDLVGNAQFVLIGEATHGTHEFYHLRAEITKRLISEKGFSAVAVEADWPDAYRVNRFVRGIGDGESADQSLAGFKGFPQWMWRNTVVLDFIRWLRRHNDAIHDATDKAGFYGLDLYSLYNAIGSVLDYLDRVDPEAAKRARYRYGCLEHFNEDPHTYGYAASFDMKDTCERDVVQALIDLQHHAPEYAQRDGLLAEDEYFFAEQNARVVKNAEAYYRSMFTGRVSSWNLRDQHMADTLDALTEHLTNRTPQPKIVVWAHNSHLGDARATEMGDQGEWNVGQLIRQRHEGRAVLIGQTTHAGTVTAASDWGEPAETKRVQPSLPESYESLFHMMSEQAKTNSFFLNLRPTEKAGAGLLRPRLERAIGVVYKPQTERISHYFNARLPHQFDGILHVDETRALQPLERESDVPVEEPPETFPSGH
jgi:erythromycin esterase-like protein